MHTEPMVRCLAIELKFLVQVGAVWNSTYKLSVELLGYTKQSHHSALLLVLLSRFDLCKHKKKVLCVVSCVFFSFQVICRRAEKNVFTSTWFDWPTSHIFLHHPACLVSRYSNYIPLVNHKTIITTW